jgi:hypothetical protein
VPDAHPPSSNDRNPGRVHRLWLGDWVAGEGPTMQAAADDLVDRVVAAARTMRAAGFRGARDTATAPRHVLRSLCEIGARVSSHEHHLELVVGSPHP